MTRDNRPGVIIADDHPLIRHGLRQIIELDQGFDVLGEVGDGESALNLIQKVQPFIAIVDFVMPKLNGLEVARRLKEIDSPVKTILITMYYEENLFKEALKAGVKGCVLKDSAASDIVECMLAVAAGQCYGSPRFTTYLVDRVRQFDTVRLLPPGLDVLTQTELRVLSLVAEYKTSRQIAQELFISPRTVETHRNNICKKLDVHGNHALIKFATEHGNSVP